MAKPSQAGTYDILVTVNNPNFAFSDGTETQTVGALTIDRREVTAAWQNLRRTYGDGQETKVLLSNVAAEDGVTAQVSGAGENAGEYEVTASLTGEDAGNYRLTRGGGATLIIQRAPVSFTVSGNTAQADGSAHFADVTPSVDFDGYTVSYRQNGQDVAEPALPGSYEIWVEITDGNYRHSGGSGGEARLVGALSIYGQAAPALYAISFQGGEGAQGDPPTLPDALAGQAITLPENPFTRAGSLFAGWEYGGALYQPGDSFLMPAGDVTFTARWVENTYAIGGIVNQGQEDGGEELVPVANAAVTLMRGAEKIDEAFTGTNGSYQFDRVAPGVYNLVVNYGGITVTRKVEIVAADVTDTRITLPAGMTNSVVRVADNIPPVVVGNLDTVFDSTDGTVYTEEDKGKVAAGATVEITFTAGEKTESAAEEDLALIQGVKAPRDQLALLMDYALSKRVEEPDQPATEISLKESSVLLEVVLFLPRDLQGKYSYSVYRVHEGEAQRIEGGPGAGEEYLTVSGDRTMLTLHVKRFSTYAVAYADQPASSGSSQDRYEDQTWEDVLQEILDSRPGDVVHLDGGRLENLPPEIMEALGENGVDLEIDWDGETIYIPAEGALTPEPGRIYYPLSELEEYYRDWQPASPALQPVPAGEAPAQEEPDAEEPSRPSEDGGVSGEEAPREEPEAQEERGVFCRIDFLTGGRTHFGCWWCWIVLLAIAALIIYKAASHKEKKEEEESSTEAK